MLDRIAAGSVGLAIIGSMAAGIADFHLAFNHRPELKSSAELVQRVITRRQVSGDVVSVKDPVHVNVGKDIVFSRYMIKSADGELYGIAALGDVLKQGHATVVLGPAIESFMEPGHKPEGSHYTLLAYNQ